MQPMQLATHGQPMQLATHGHGHPHGLMRNARICGALLARKSVLSFNCNHNFDDYLGYPADQ